MDVFDMGKIAARYDTEMAHAMLHAVAVAVERMARTGSRRAAIR